MELTILPQEKNLQRSYRHYSVPNQKETAAVAKKPQFFFIGKKTGNIHILINSFESGYGAENYDHARSMLKRLSDQAGTRPDIIFAEAVLGIEGLKELHKFLAADIRFNEVPLIVDATNISVEELSKLRSLRFIDDIVFLKGYSRSQLVTKVNFWKKVKKNPAPTIETSTPVYFSFPAMIKRLFDILVSATLIAILSPVFLLVGLALKLEAKGPIFYISKRAGRGYKIFDFYKFRTMVEGADKQIGEFSHLNQYRRISPNGPVFMKICDDPRVVTRLGAFLRKTSLDELPQLFNVLKGDMSLVGNRPLPLYEAASLTTDEWAKRFLAPAGITGLWQIKKRGQSKMSVEERITLDIDYANKSNFFYDLWIMANTPSAIIQKTNS